MGKFALLRAVHPDCPFDVSLVLAINEFTVTAIQPRRVKLKTAFLFADLTIFGAQRIVRATDEEWRHYRSDSHFPEGITHSCNPLEKRSDYSSNISRKIARTMGIASVFEMPGGSLGS